MPTWKGSNIPADEWMTCSKLCIIIVDDEWINIIIGIIINDGISQTCLVTRINSVVVSRP